jgi:hypothetical protein
VAPDHFTVENVDAIIELERDRAGPVTALVLVQNGAR